jgi:anthraniloyl-CoA monooxygenase
VVLKNRIVVSPMAQYSAEDGAVGDYHLMHLGARALGGAALVMAEMTCVSADARITPGCPGMYKPGHTQAWKRIVDFVHANSDAKIGIQLGHAGAKGSTRRAWDGIDLPLEDGNWPLVSASRQQYVDGVSQVAREATLDDLERIKADCVWRIAGPALPLSARGVRRGPRCVAFGTAGQRARVGPRLGRRRHHAG